MAATIRTDVLVIGTGPAGASAALALATYGIDVLVVTKYGRLADSPRAHITNQRTMEVMRDLGIEDQITAEATPQELMGNLVYCTSIAGEELGRLRAWGPTRPDRWAEYVAASPCRICDLPQDLMEPILVTNAQARGATIRYDTEYCGLRQSEDAVTVTVRDRLRQDEYEIEARYVVGADGGRSMVVEDLGLPLEGQMGVSGSINIVFEADLTELVACRPSVLYWVLQPGADVGGIGAGLVRMVRPWHTWLIVWGYDINGSPPDLSESFARSIVQRLLGDDDIAVRILSSSAWTVNHLYACRYSSGRVFCAGDAVHRHPPSNGLGSNTSIQDSFNLAWKLAAVIQGRAGPGLLESYSDERASVGKQVVDRANQSILDTSAIFEALGMEETADAETMQANMANRTRDTPAAETQRAALHAAIAFKDYEFNTHGVELNQCYASSAVVGDGSPRPAVLRDPELYHQPTSRPGAKLPHAWLVGPDRSQVSTLDLVGHGHFGLITGIGGQLWVRAAEEVGRRLGLELVAAVIGPRHLYEDLYGEWAQVREIDDGGVLLTRPDNYVAFRSIGPPRTLERATQTLEAALRQVLDRP